MCSELVRRCKDAIGFLGILLERILTIRRVEVALGTKVYVPYLLEIMRSYKAIV
jgi:hypothetical protein